MTFFTRTGKQLPKVIVDQAEKSRKTKLVAVNFWHWPAPMAPQRQLPIPY